MESWLLTLLDVARAEAKRFGDDAPGLTHLVLALADRSPDLVSSVIGDEAVKRIRHHLGQHGRIRVTDDEALEFLEETRPDDDREVAELLRDQLEDVIAGRPDSEPTEASASSTKSTSKPQSTKRRSIASTSPYWEPIEPGEILGRQRLTDEIISCLGRRTPAAPLVIGPPGSGRTSLLQAVAARMTTLPESSPLASMPVLRVNAESIVADERARTLRTVIDAAPRPAVLALDDLEVLSGMTTSGADFDLLGVVRAAMVSDLRILLTIDDAFAGRIEVLAEELHGEVVPMRIEPLDREELRSVVDRSANELEEFHGVSLPREVRSLAQLPRSSIDKMAHPGLAISRLDGACVRAQLRAETSVKEEDLGLTDQPDVAPVDRDHLIRTLSSEIVGQDRAIDVVASRAALTRARLDLRPERPDGVFLFVGPTGVGKTALALAMCEALFGDRDRMIRLDMSEYVHDWAVSRIIGPQPGYVGSTEPSAWLTTRIREVPETVLLLDEIEKAHPVVWNTFLQVFDAGRLSDSRGQVADFSRVVVAMTSNLGADAFSAPSVGFRAPGTEDAAEEARVIEAVRDAMAPELVNRLDDVVVFQPLSPQTIADIAERELDATVQRLAERGYQLSIAPDVHDLIASSGFDPAFGARHLHRNIERLFLHPLVEHHDRRLRAEVDGERIVWTPS